MFDSLKEKLGRFREDVEETAEEKAESAEADAPDAPELPEDDPVEPVEAEGDTEPDRTGSDAGATAVETDPEARASEVEVGSTESVTEDGDSDPDGANKNTGFVRKAKSMARGQFVIEADDLEDPLWELEMALIQNDVEMDTAEEILDGIEQKLVGETRGFRKSTGRVVRDALRSALLDVISVGRFEFDRRIERTDEPVVIVFTGVNGVGKTTTIAKMARYFEKRGLSTVLANGDTYRAGANEQIREHARKLDEKLISHERGGDPAAVIYDAVEYAEANDVDVVLADTAGRLHTDSDLMDQLEKIHRVVDPDLTLFVDEAVAGQDATKRAKQFDESAEIDGAILTKADADAQGGAAISIAHVTGKPILFLGTGQGYDDIERFDPEWMVDRLLEEG